MPESPHLSDPALPPRYRLAEEIGRGGMGAVFRAEDLEQDRFVAVKVLNPEFSDPTRIARFLKEIHLTKDLTHPNILPIYDSGAHQGLLYFTMPLVDGDSLRSRLDSEGALPIPDTLRILEDVASALDFAHQRGILHRDIKPENIVLQGNRAIVLDFGVARAMSEAADDKLTTAGTSVGTPAYMSPEQAAGHPSLDPRSDVYSLGCVLFEMLGGESPFSGRTPRAVIAKQVSQPPPPLRVIRPSISEPVEAVVRKSLEKVPGDRYRTAGEMAADLKRAVTTPTTRQGQRLRQWMGVALTILIVGYLGARWVGIGSSAPEAETPGWYPLTEVAARPFQDGTPEGGYGWLGTALASDIIDALSDVDVISSRPMSAVRAFPPDQYPVDSLGARLGIGTLVDGRIDRIQDSIRVSVYLISTRQGLQMGPVIREAALLGSEGTLRRDLMEEVVHQLRRNLGEEIQLGSWHAESAHPEAWSLLARAQARREAAQDLASGGDFAPALAALNEAEALLSQAASVDPDWVRPKIHLGRVLLDKVRTADRAVVTESPGAPDTMTVRRWIRDAVLHADRAWSLDRSRPEALEVRGGAALLEWKWTHPPRPDSLLNHARADLEQCVQQDPSRARAWLDLSTVYQYQGSFEEGRRATENAILADAWLEESQSAVMRRMFDALRTGNPEQAGTDCEFGRDHYPGNPDFLQCRLVLLGWYGDVPWEVEEAWAELETIEADSTSHRASGGGWQYRRALVAATAARAGLPDSALAILGRTRTPPSPTHRDPHWLFYEAYVQQLSGNPDTAVSLLEQYLEQQPEYRTYARDHRWFQGLRTHPRFMEVTGGG